MSSTIGLLHPKYIFGLSGSCHATNVYFLDANTIIYPAGNTVVMYNMDQKTQTFLHGVEKGNGVTALNVSHTKTYAAVAQLGEKPSVTVFDVKLNKRRKTLVFAETTAVEIVSVAFTADGQHLATLTGAPEYALLLWRWDKGRMVGQAKTTGGVGPVYEISASAHDNNVMCAVGRSSFRFFRSGEGHMKPFGFQKGDSYHFLCHAWLGKSEKLIAGTKDGRLMYFERGDYKADISIPVIATTTNQGSLERSARESVAFAGGTSLVNLGNLVGLGGEGEGNRGSSGSKKSVASSYYDSKGVTAIMVYSKGFAIGYGAGYVIVYEAQVVYESPDEHFKPIHVIRVPFQSAETSDKLIRALAINSTEETLVASTANAQLLYFSLSSAEIKDPNEMYFEYACASFHYGAVMAVDVAMRKSLFVTLGADKCLRIWNYATMCQEASKEFLEEIHCVSFHPTGLFLVAGCVDKIRVFAIVMDDIREVKDFHVRGCKEVVFSNGGHLFAAANGNIIQLYSATSYENIGNMKGHTNKIRRLRWSHDDSALVSVGSDGAIYEWDVVGMHRGADYVERGVDMLDVTTSPDGKTLYAISTNNFVKEIQIQDGILLKEVNLELGVKCVSMSHSGRLLVGGMEGGVVRSLRQPLTYSNEWFDFHVHFDTINAIRITFDEAYCISVSEDGSVIVWRITDAEGRSSKLEKDILYGTEVLITKADLDEREIAMQELKQKFGELRLEMEYQMKRKEMGYLEEMKGTTATFNAQLDERNAKIRELVETKEEHDGRYHEFVEDMAAEQKLTLENIKAHFNTRLISEFEKYNELQTLLEETIRDYEGKLTTLDADAEGAVDELVGYFEGKIKDKASALDEAYDEARTTLLESDEMKKQIEEDADAEILDLTHSYEKRLRREQEANAKLLTESSVMKRNFAAMNHEIEDQKEELVKLQHEGDKMKATIMISEKEVQSLRKDLVDRDVNVMGKEKVIYDLKKTNGELEKYKFVLDYKIKELKKMIEPKERETIYLRQQNGDMEQELMTIVAVRNGLELQVNELTNKLRVTDQEYQIERRLRWMLQVLVSRIRSYMSRCMSLLQDHHALQTAFKAMYAKYGHSLEGGRASNAEEEAICELVRQKNYLELALSSLKRKMAKEVDTGRSEQLKIMNENMLLVFEINRLREELKVTRDRVQAYELCLGILPTNFKNSKTMEMKLKLQAVTQDQEDVILRHDKAVQEKQNVIDAQVDEIQYLTDKVLKAEENASGIDDLSPDLILQI